MALLLLMAGGTALREMPSDVFPNIEIPVVAVAWTYTGLNPEDLETRLTTPYEKILTTLVDNVQHTESTTYNGSVVVKIFLHPGASVDAANAQVVSASQFILRFLPPGLQPPMVVNYSASSVPVLQLGLSGKNLSEQEVNDLALNVLRPQLITVPGAVIPLPYGGKMRQIMINLDNRLMRSKGVSPADVLSAVNDQNLIFPSGTSKIGGKELYVRLNVTPRTVAELNELPIKQIDKTIIYLREVASVSEGFAVQQNIVRNNGLRSVLMIMLKSGQASTLDVVAGIHAALLRAKSILPEQFKVSPLSDQSMFVRSAVDGLIREGVIAGCLTALMILLFLGNWRSTLIIAVSIPLSILTSVIVLNMLHETINLMTLGGLALAVGILVDDATVMIESVSQIIESGDASDVADAIRRGSQSIAAPALLSTLCICIVFMPLFLLSGVSRYLFVPLAEAVVIAMLASYVLSRTLAPTMAMYMLKLHVHAPESRHLFVLFERGFERRFAALRASYQDLLTSCVSSPLVFIPTFLTVVALVFLLVPWLGQDFFPQTDNGQILLHARTSTGMQIEETAKIADEIESFVRAKLPKDEIENIVDNIGLPLAPLNLIHATSGVAGANDVDILVSLTASHHPTADYVRALRRQLARQFPEVTFYFLPADMVTQILNFGLPSPIDIQIEGGKIEVSHDIAQKLLAKLKTIPGLVDLHIHQNMDYPTIDVDVNRTKALQTGMTERDVASSVLNSLSGSFQITPMFFVNWVNGVNYNLVVQTPQYHMQSLSDVQNIPVTGKDKSNAAILTDVASMRRAHQMAIVSHFNIRRVIDVYGGLEGRDLGAVSRDVEKIVSEAKKKLPRGSFITIRGQIETMRASYAGLLTGLAFAIVLVYLMMVVYFHSWLDPIIILMALPGAMAGIVLVLFFTKTTLSVPALMGALMSVGVATANSILVVSQARERLALHGQAARAAIEAGVLRLRPVIMTALAMIIGMLPMALGLGEGGEQNVPLGRSVVGGLLFATLATLVFVPAVFAWLHKNTPVTPPQPAALEGGR